jgi:RNA polymerase sigma-70 factor, ECF subfamily
VRTDEDLAVGVQRGTMNDLSELVERHYSPLFGYLYRMCGGVRSVAEDMVQETFLRVMHGISSYQPSRPFKPWLYAIASNIAHNFRTRADSRYTDNLPDEAEIDNRADDSDAPETMLIDSQEADAVLKALSALPQHQRDVVILFYYQELSQQHISEIMHIPVGTVKSRLSLGLRRMHALLIEQGAEE